VISWVTRKGFNKFSRKREELGEEIQSAVIDYSEKHNEHYAKNYVYVWYEFGRVDEDKQRLVQQYMLDEMKGKDCFGSINYYKGFFDGLLMMTHAQFDKMRSEMRDMFMVEKFDIISDSDVTYRVHDKWGRARPFILFD
jgi:hypothetical protein